MLFSFSWLSTIPLYWIYHNWLILSSLDVYLGYFHINTLVNMYVHALIYLFLIWRGIYLGYTSINIIAGLYGEFMCYFLRNCQTILHSG